MDELFSGGDLHARVFLFFVAEGRDRFAVVVAGIDANFDLRALSSFAKLSYCHSAFPPGRSVLPQPPMSNVSPVKIRSSNRRHMASWV